MTIRPLKRELPYAAFARHLSGEENAPAPAPVDPVKRVTADLIQRLAGIKTVLANAQIDALTLFPDAVRLKLSKEILAAAERMHAIQTRLETFDRFGTLTPPRGHAPRRKAKFKP